MPNNVPADFVDIANERYPEAKKFWANWQTDARDDFAFVSGNQWLADDKDVLNEQKRPPITFNYSEKMIDAVVGAEVSARQEVTYSPRGMEDAPLAETWTNAAKWVRDNCDAEDEESEAFRDALICGMGWTHSHMSYIEDLDGKLVIDRVDPLEMLSDPTASKSGLADRRYNFRIWWVDEKEVKRMWPNAMTFPEDDMNTGRGVIRQGHRYEDSDEEQDIHKDQVQIRYYECVENEPVYRVATQNGVIEVPPADFSGMKEALDAAGIQHVKQFKRVYYYGFFAGDSLLEGGPSPCQVGFCYQPITCKRDRNKKTWYGLTRVMKDPQRWANKWLSQILHIINTNAKGGLLAEAGAFVDPTKAAEEWAQPDSITLLNEGGINKIEQKTMAGYPSGLDRLMEFALSSLPMVTGINLEALGLANRDQANVLEQSRKQAAYGLLAPLFNSLRRYRKNQGRVMLAFIHKFISDGRMVRIGGPESQQFIPLTHQEDAPEYDIIVDQSPSSPDVKEKTWTTLGQIIPAMMKAGIPIPPDLLDFTPLPISLVTKWKQFISQQQQTSPQMQAMQQQFQQQMQQMQQQLQQLAQENQSLKADQSNEQIKLTQNQHKVEAELVLKAQVQEQTMALDRAKAEADFQLAQLKQEQEFELQQRQIAHDCNMKQQQIQGDLKIKAFTAGVNAPNTGSDKMTLEVDMKPLADALEQIANSSKQSNEAVSGALDTLAEALSKPRKLVTDAFGKPIGSQPVNKL